MKVGGGAVVLLAASSIAGACGHVDSSLLRMEKQA